MPLFKIAGPKLTLTRPTNFKQEKEIQSLIEKNLETVFNCRFVASEFPTGAEHSGRIDTLALSEDNNPVIIEYKKVESSELINQSLYYLSWIRDHKGDFQVAVNKRLGGSVKIDWNDIRVLCIAPGYKKYDLHAVQMMGANIELWQYRLFENGALYLEEVFKRSASLAGDVAAIAGKNPVMVAAGKKAAVTRATGSYNFADHLKKADKNIKRLVNDLREYILGIDAAVEETPKKFYIAYKVAQNFACIVVMKSKVILYLKLTPAEFKSMPKNARDMRNTGHYGTGDFQLIIRTPEEAEEARKYVRLSFERVGG
jgi:predicted transport protein